MPKTFSVVITTYNSSNTIHRALRSVRSAFPADDVEVCVVDDCSADFARLKRICDTYREVKLIRMDRKGNANISRNAGFDASSGNIVFFLDADDEFVPGAGARRMAMHRENGAGFIFGAIRVLADGVPIAVRNVAFIGSDMRSYRFIEGGDTRTSTFSICRDFHLGTRFDENLEKHQDSDFAIASFDRGEVIFYDPVPISVIHVDSGSAIRMSNSFNSCASQYFIEKNLTDQRHINGFCRSHILKLLNRLCADDLKFFLSYYKPSGIREWGLYAVAHLFTVPLLGMMFCPAVGEVRRSVRWFRRNLRG